jgi:hypothetical protein
MESRVAALVGGGGKPRVGTEGGEAGGLVGLRF